MSNGILFFFLMKYLNEGLVGGSGGKGVCQQVQQPEFNPRDPHGGEN